MDHKKLKTLVNKPTVNDVAKMAGVSLATVDRVLNERPGVRSVTIEKVMGAVTSLGYVRDAAAANLARQRFYRFLFILPETVNEFVLALERDIARLATRNKHQRTTLSCLKIAPFDPLALVTALDDLDANEIDGVSVFGPDTPEVGQAIERARQRGIAVATLVADLPSSQRHHFVGIDNVAAGRTAARLMGRFMGGDGRILIITGSHLANDHLERINGFEALIQKDFPGIEIVATLEGRDDADLIHERLPDVFTTNPSIGGIYSAAAGNPGLIRYLRETEQHNDTVVIVHELTDSSQDALANGIFDVVISQDTGHLVRSATRLLMATVDQIPFDQSQERIRIDVLLFENMPHDSHTNENKKNENQIENYRSEEKQL
jgi:LacI family transcriptional regulator